jgi:hypothetical protein
MSDFLFALKHEVRRLRRRFADVNASHMAITITIDGAPDHGDIAVTFSVAESKYGDAVEGKDVDQCVREFFRRKGWKQENNAILISYLPSEDD